MRPGAQNSHWTSHGRGPRLNASYTIAAKQQGIRPIYPWKFWQPQLKQESIFDFGLNNYWTIVQKIFSSHVFFRYLRKTTALTARIAQCPNKPLPAPATTARTSHCPHPPYCPRCVPALIWELPIQDTMSVHTVFVAVSPPHSCEQLPSVHSSTALQTCPIGGFGWHGLKSWGPLGHTTV